jgi:molybdate transport system substrate-binding protein
MKHKFAWPNIAAAALLSIGSTTFANAAEVKVLAARVLQTVLEEIAPQFERATGHKLVFVWGIGSEIAKKVMDGETGDVTVVTKAQIDDLVAKGKVVRGSEADVARSNMGVAVKAGAPKPDIKSVEAFKQALLAANSVAYTDPATGGTSGVHFVRVIERLGIADNVKAKAKMSFGPHVGGAVAKGEAEIAVQQIPELMAIPGVDVVGPLPTELQNTLVVSAGVLAGSTQPDAGKALMNFLAAPSTVVVIKAKGLEPGRP